MPDSPPIASRTFDLLQPDGARIRFTASFGPIYERDNSHRCPLHYEGWNDSTRDIFGEDSVQAFLLAVTCLNAELTTFIKRGGRVVFAETNDDCPLETISTAP